MRINIFLRPRRYRCTWETLHYSYARLKPFAHARGYFSRAHRTARPLHPAIIHRTLVPSAAARHYVLRRRDQPSRPHPGVWRCAGGQPAVRSRGAFNLTATMIDSGVWSIFKRPPSKHEGTRSRPESTPSRVKIGSPHESIHA